MAPCDITTSSVCFNHLGRPCWRSTKARPRRASLCRSARDSATRRVWASKPFRSPGACVSPVSPSRTSSGTPPTAEATTHSPEAIASITAPGNPSSYDGNSRIERDRRRAGTSSLRQEPAASNTRSRPYFLRTESPSASAGPSPTISIDATQASGRAPITWQKSRKPFARVARPRKTKCGRSC